MLPNPTLLLPIHLYLMADALAIIIWVLSREKLQYRVQLPQRCALDNRSLLTNIGEGIIGCETLSAAVAVIRKRQEKLHLAFGFTKAALE